jgi:hypothetical protein
MTQPLLVLERAVAVLIQERALYRLFWILWIQRTHCLGPCLYTEINHYFIIHYFDIVMCTLIEDHLAYGISQRL